MWGEYQVDPNADFDCHGMCCMMFSSSFSTLHGLAFLFSMQSESFSLFFRGQVARQLGARVQCSLQQNNYSFIELGAIDYIFKRQWNVNNIITDKKHIVPFYDRSLNVVMTCLMWWIHNHVITICFVTDLVVSNT